MISHIQIGERIKYIRNRINMSQDDLAAKADISTKTLSRIETGVGHNFGIETIYKIAKSLGVSMDIILDEDYFLEDLQEYFQDYPELIEETKSIAETFYSSNADEIGSNKILQFFIYLPLIDIGELFDVLLRLDGDVFSREQYLVRQIEYLIRIISDENPAKLYADYRAAQCSYKHLRRHYLDGPDYNLDEDIFKSYIAYRALIEKKREMTKIFFNLFEKIYDEKGSAK